MDVNDRIRSISKAGINARKIADTADVSYYRISSVINPKKYRGESTFDKYETKRINDALDSIVKAFVV